MTEIIKNDPNLLHSFLLFEYDDVKPSTSSDGIVKMKGIIQAAGKPNAKTESCCNGIYKWQFKFSHI